MKEKNFELTEERKADIEDFKYQFLEEVNFNYLKEYDDGFLGVGIFNKPKDHSQKGVNSVCIVSTGFNGKGDRIVCSGYQMTYPEAFELYEGLYQVLEEMTKRRKKEAKDERRKNKNN